MLVQKDSVRVSQKPVWRKRVAMTALACLLFGFLITSAGAGFQAYAQEDTAESPASALPQTTDRSKEDPHGAVEVSSDGLSARTMDGLFGLSNFNRAQVGSNKEIEGVYYGYSYYISNESGSIAIIASETYAIAYIPPAVVEEMGFDLQNEAHTNELKELFIALDEGLAQGSKQLGSIESWYFTDEQECTIDEVVYGFDQELKTGQFYLTVQGSDGSDITEASNPLYTPLVFADSANLFAAEDLEIIPAATGFKALVEFVKGIDYSPLKVTLKTTGVAIVIIFVLGLAAAYFSLRIPPRAQDIADSIFTIPMVLPPTVCGFLLLMGLGRNTAIGSWFIEIGFPLVFSWQATVLAAVVVAFPLMYRSARGAFESLDITMLDAARTLGWSNRRIFFKLMLPLSWSSIAAGTVLSFARALGEFGATMFLAGNYVGITRTIPLAIYFEWMNGNTDVAIFWTIIIMIMSFIVILFINLWGRRNTKYRRRFED